MKATKSIVLFPVLIVLTMTVCFADEGDDTLRFYLGKSDLVVEGSITEASGGDVEPLGMLHYFLDVRVDSVVKGDPSLKGRTISVEIVRFETDKKDKHPLLTKDSECILFLKDAGTKDNPRWQSADSWFSIQYPSQSMATSLKRLAAEKAGEESGRETGYTEFDPPEIEGGGEWGEETMGLVGRITTSKAEYTIGEDVYILVEVKNNLDKPIALGRRISTTLSQERTGTRRVLVTESNLLGGARSFPETDWVDPGKTYSEIICRLPGGGGNSVSLFCLFGVRIEPWPVKTTLQASLEEFPEGDLKGKELPFNGVVFELKEREGDSEDISNPDE